MPVIKVRENEPFDVALRRFKRSCEKFVVANVMKSQLGNVNVKKQLQLNAQRRKFLVRTLVTFACTKIC